MNFLADIFRYKECTEVTGLTDELSVLYCLNYFYKKKSNILIVTNSLYEANKVYQKIKTYIDDVCLFPMDDFLSSVALAISPDLKVKRLETLESIKKGEPKIVVTNLMGYLRFLPSLKDADKYKIELDESCNIDRKKLIDDLELLGYKNTTLVTSTGEYALRGYIIDIFPIESSHPIRIEFFGDEIESMRYFNEESQLSIDHVDRVTILPIEEIQSEENNSLYDYMQMPAVFFFDKSQILSGYTKILNDMHDYKESKRIPDDYKYMYSFDELKVDVWFDIKMFNSSSGDLQYDSKMILKFDGDYNRLKVFCETEVSDRTVIICLSKKSQIEKISDLFNHVNYDNVVLKSINIVEKRINEGFIINDYVVISEYDIDNTKSTNSYRSSYKIGRKIKDFSDLKIGDYVVHSLHGIGIYGGIVPITKNDMTRDYIMINYLGNDKVYVPVEKISSIYKYSDADGQKPKINKLNSSSWAKTKMRVRSKIHDISDELIKLYAARNNIKGAKYADFPEEALFDSQFIYNETSDQLKCIDEIAQDLRSQVPMDRLLCGDVGFGKTEVAFRGIFKTVLNGFQVAYLCPTTLLSRQQYYNAVERFKEFPVNIALLNRFTSQKEVKRIVDGLKNGSIDVVFGTHKLFNKNIDYKNLGLLIIDEEQRFGVLHKEKIKELKNDVNVLTLSATPIPRTLKMAMSGLRDLSIIDTAPVNRYPVQTYVLEENDVLIKDAIYKELSRNGQVFILYNKVMSITDEMDRIQRLVPEAKIVIAHGKMDKNELEKVVTDFVDYKYDILICTTIIETGIDIPNVNTLIVIDADNFGLSQLYQLRGRVGRSDKIAYAYLMYKPSKVLTETAIKRLKSIKDFTELGSGYKIAMRDLAIRGAGDLLGSEQAGFVDSIGLELYMQMVNDELRRLKGEDIEEDENDTPLIEVANHISDEYVKEESLKIEIHKLINNIQDEKSLESIKAEIEDRFGKISDEMEIYMYEEWFEKMAKKLNIRRVRQNENVIELELPEDISNKIDGEKLFLIIFNINPRFRLSYRMKKITVSLPLLRLEKHFIFYETKLLNEIINMIDSK